MLLQTRLHLKKKNCESKEVAIIKGHCIYLYYFEKKNKNST